MGRGTAAELGSAPTSAIHLTHKYGSVDLLALANIGVLNGQAGTRKFESAATVLRDRPEEVDLRIETEGPRTGMWSVVQLQWVTQVRRVR